MAGAVDPVHARVDRPGLPAPVPGRSGLHLVGNNRGPGDLVPGLLERTARLGRPGDIGDAAGADRRPGPYRHRVGAGRGRVDLLRSVSGAGAQAPRDSLLDRRDRPGADLVGFHVYGSPAAGESVDYATPLETITAYPGGIATGGSGSYGWTSDALDSGTWSFAVVPFDAAGNLGTTATSSVAISVPPREPVPFAGVQARLQYTYSASIHEATLSWNPSPS